MSIELGPGLTLRKARKEYPCQRDLTYQRLKDRNPNVKPCVHETGVIAIGTLYAEDYENGAPFHPMRWHEECMP